MLKIDKLNVAIFLRVHKFTIKIVAVRLNFCPFRWKIVKKRRSRFVTVAHALDRRDVAFADFLAQLADMDVDGAVADHHFVAPDAGVDLFARNQFSR